MTACFQSCTLAARSRSVVLFLQKSAICSAPRSPIRFLCSFRTSSPASMERAVGPVTAMLGLFKIALPQLHLRTILCALLSSLLLCFYYCYCRYYHQYCHHYHDRHIHCRCFFCLLLLLIRRQRRLIRLLLHH